MNHKSSYLWLTLDTDFFSNLTLVLCLCHSVLMKSQSKELRKAPVLETY